MVGNDAVGSWDFLGLKDDCGWFVDYDASKFGDYEFVGMKLNVDLVIPSRLQGAIVQLDAQNISFFYEAKNTIVCACECNGKRREYSWETKENAEVKSRVEALGDIHVISGGGNPKALMIMFKTVKALVMTAGHVKGLELAKDIMDIVELHTPDPTEWFDPKTPDSYDFVCSSLGELLYTPLIHGPPTDLENE
jgi:hypothetical protein